MNPNADGQADAVLVANGHHWDPRWPEPPFPGEFNGRQLHAHDYKDPDGMVGQSILVLGIGNSATDIAVETESEYNTCIYRDPTFCDGEKGTVRAAWSRS